MCKMNVQEKKIERQKRIFSIKKLYKCNWSTKKIEIAISKSDGNLFF